MSHHEVCYAMQFDGTEYISLPYFFPVLLSSTFGFCYMIYLSVKPYCLVCLYIFMKLKLCLLS